MNHLRDLLDSLSVSITTSASSGITAEDLQRIGDRTAIAGEWAVAFSMGDLSSIIDLQVVPELVRLPYQTCWFECEIRPPSAPNIVLCAGLLVHTADNGKGDGTVWLKRDGEWRFLGAVLNTHLHADEWVAASKVDHHAQAVLTLIRGTQCFLSALHCSNVRRQEHAPDAKLQKARAKRGKAPLFSYWTLQLDGKTERGEDRGGTHASPRVHLRRGHPRQYVPGKWTWVQAHAVGNRAAGVVHKDYSAGLALTAAAR